MRSFSLLVSTSLFIFSLAATGQDFRDGFVITIKGDSIAGQAEYPSTNKHASYCYFRIDDKSSVTKYTPSDLQAYGFINDRRYEAKDLVINSVSERRFLQVLVKGELSFYRLGDVFYFERDSLQELPAVTRSVFSTGGSSYYKSEKKYVGILNILLNECSLRADDTPYKERDLINLIQNYNRCLGQEGKVYKENLPWTNFYFQAFGGYSFSKLTAKNFNDVIFSPSTGAYAGIGVDVSAPRINDKLFLSLEPSFYKILYQGYGEDVSSTITIRNDYIMDVTLLKTPLGVRYNFWSEKHTPYVRLGYILSFDLGSTYKHIEEKESSGTINTSVTDQDLVSKTEQGIWFAAGYSQLVRGRSKIFFELRFERNLGYYYGELVTPTRVNNLNFAAGIRF